MKALIPVAILALASVASADVVVPVDAVESYVNIRQAPDPDAEPVSRLHRSRPRERVATADGWHEVRIDAETTGFVSAEWSLVVPDQADDPASTVAEAPSGAEETASIATEAPSASETPVAAGDGIDAPDSGAAPEVEQIAEQVDSAVADPGEDVESEAMVSTQSSDASPVIDEAGAGESDETPNTPVEAPATSAEEPSDGVAIAGPPGPQGPPGPPGPPGEPGDGAIKGSQNYLVKFRKNSVGGNSQVYDDGNFVGIGTTDPKQRLEVNGSIQIHEQSSSVAGLMITQASGDTGYILHNAASTLTIGAGSQDRITIDRSGFVGFGNERPLHPIDMASGAHVTAGGVWTNSSSRSRKQDIAGISLDAALAALAELKPVQYRYREESGETYLGFIAEDVPDLVAMSDRTSLSPMDIVAVLTRVVQEQQARIDALEDQLARRAE